MNAEQRRWAKLTIAERQAEIREGQKRARETWTYDVYRCYAKNGVLLYIGCTQDVGSRMAVHASSWRNPASAALNLYMDRYEVEQVVGYSAARAVEKAAIEAEAPLLNLHYNKGRGLKRVKVEPPTGDEVSAALDAMWSRTSLGRRSA